MRAAPLLLGLLACTALTGCDWWDRALPAQARCHCTAPVPVAAAPAPPLRQAQYAERETGAYRGHAYRHHRRHDWHRREAERSVDIYGYSSSSQGYAGSGYGYGADHDNGCCGDDEWHARDGETTRIWADGYGRRHLYDESAVRHYAYQAHVRRRDEPARLDPWHGYDDDWD